VAPAKHRTIGLVPSTFIGLSVTDVLSHILAVASSAASAPVAVHVGDDAFGCRNVGIELPRGRRSAEATRMMRLRVREALEQAGVVLAESALAPRVPGDIRGSVRVRVVAPTYADAAHMLQPPRRG
jgi:hypothetical protein